MNSQQQNYNQTPNNQDKSQSYQKWGSPAAGNVRFSPYQNNRASFSMERSPRHRQYNPQFSDNPQNVNFRFRTPQPMQRHSSPPSRSWTGGDYNKRHYNNISPIKRFQHFKNYNPGGSNDLDQYYHPSMLQDPWLYLKPCLSNQVPPPTVCDITK